MTPSQIPPPESRQQSSLVLLSGGLDSAVLAAQEAQTRIVHPVYVAAGLAWEEGELRVVQELLSHAPLHGRATPLARLDFNMRDIYLASHWAIRGTPPAYDTPDEDVYLHGRNVALLSKAAVYAATKNISRLVVAPLAGNPFPDATSEFFSAFSKALSIGLDMAIEISAPLGHLHKEDVVKLGAELNVPFSLTLSCMNPSFVDRPSSIVDRQSSAVDRPSSTMDDGRSTMDDRRWPIHCGLCSKCRERRDAFQTAGINDPTSYAHVSPR